MVHNPGSVAAKMFEALYNAGINISMISTSEIKVSVLVDINEADRAVQVDRFFHGSAVTKNTKAAAVMWNARKNCR